MSKSSLPGIASGAIGFGLFLVLPPAAALALAFGIAILIGLLAS